MYTKLSGEFDSIEFAESAARYIRERVSGYKKISIFKNKNRFLKCASGREELESSYGATMRIYPFSSHSTSNFTTGMMAKETDESQVNELLRTKSVRMEVVCESEKRDMTLQYMISCGAYDLKG